ncbi:hypothetical protein [Deinococcus humi]|uniref:Uncharacterized protein n=1 Tax=Deinococcus humi TaxID=662880 RepID=A0A7W8JWL5_9DEIO|nr:hypothetical protein [Deinococcus humi]MBB5364582.1 hypothetical protein [Deinococcus humi]
MLKQGMRAGAAPEALAKEWHQTVLGRVYELTGRTPVLLPMVIA